MKDPRLPRHPMRSLFAGLALLTAAGIFPASGAENLQFQNGEAVEGNGVWIDPTIGTAAEGPIRVTVWFDRQFLGDGKAFERRTKEFAGASRRELRTRIVALLKQLSERSYAAAKDALTERLANGEIQEIERHWIVNGFSCTTNAAGARNLAGVPGVKKVFDTRDKLPLPKTSLVPKTTSVQPAARPAPIRSR